MGALDLLNRVSDTYRKLSSLSVEASIITESGDENENQRSEQRVRFLYAAPDRIRFEPLGKRGVLRICDGTQIHTLFRFGGPVPAGGPRYNSVPAKSQPLPHSFQPDRPSGDAVLFTRISELVKETETLPDENGYRVVSVTYESRPMLHISTSPVRFWIDPVSFWVRRMQVSLGHRLPAHDEVDWTRHTVAIRQLRADEPTPRGTFDFAPPADAVEQSGRRGMISGRGGGGFSRPAAPGQRGMEHHGSHEWQGETLVEHSKWRIGDRTLTMERRMTFADGDRTVEIVERTTGPKGEAETRCALDLI